MNQVEKRHSEQQRAREKEWQSRLDAERNENAANKKALEDSLAKLKAEKQVAATKLTSEFQGDEKTKQISELQAKLADSLNERRLLKTEVSKLKTEVAAQNGLKRFVEEEARARANLQKLYDSKMGDLTQA